MARKGFTSQSTPPPAGTYSVAMQAGHLVFLSGQTLRISNAPNPDWVKVLAGGGMPTYVT